MRQRKRETERRMHWESRFQDLTVDPRSPATEAAAGVVNMCATIARAIDVAAREAREKLRKGFREERGSERCNSDEEGKRDMAACKPGKREHQRAHRDISKRGERERERRDAATGNEVMHQN